MADWLDRWARRAASSADPEALAPLNGRRMSRRQLLKRAGVVAGATWTVPMIQSAVAPAAAVSGQLTGTICTSDSQCSTHYCDPTGHCGSPDVWWSGYPCTTNTQCWSGVCLGGTCKSGALAKSCSTAADCQDNVNCSALTQTCGGTGASCQNNNKCISGICQPSGVCA